MTVSELIERLSKYPGDLRVIFVDDGCMSADIGTVEIDEDQLTDTKIVVLDR